MGRAVLAARMALECGGDSQWSVIGQLELPEGRLRNSS